MNQDFDYPQNFEIDGYELRLTCESCPEQYDVYWRDDQVGYLRLRHGWFRADNTVNNTVYTTTNCRGDGIFEPDERQEFLTKAINRIHLDRVSSNQQDLAGHIANVLLDKYKIYENNPGPDLDFVDINELTATIEEAISGL